MFQSVTLGDFDAAQVLVLGLFQGGTIDGYIKKLSPTVALAARAAASRSECTGESGKIGEGFPVAGEAGAGGTGGTGGVPERVIVLGLGKKSAFKVEGLRGAIATLGKRLTTIKAKRVHLQLAGALDEAEANLEACGRVIGETLGLMAWDNLIFKGTGTEDRKKERGSIEVNADKKAVVKGIGLGLMLAESANLTRTLSETPPNIATPAFMSDQAKKLAKSCGLEFSVLSGKELEKERLVGHINVGKASENKPVFIRLKYTPEKVGRKKDKPAVLVGKTMTYDTGGLSLKVNNGMVGMKRDKDGGCAVLGAMHAIATAIKPDRPVVALLCVAENSVSDEAYRPDDIITYRNGVTVEVTNTDAEGRLVLADGLIWACEKEDPAYIVDLATLTGGVVVALGSTYCGMFCEDDALRAKVEAASEGSGERVWRLPMHSEYKEMMKSPVADILNSNPNRKAHPIQGAAFLAYFVKEGVPWCHLDIAGVHATESESGPFVKGPTGWGVRILAELLKRD
jgi:leucyl aminopeptidase